MGLAGGSNGLAEVAMVVAAAGNGFATVGAGVAEVGQGPLSRCGAIFTPYFWRLGAGE